MCVLNCVMQLMLLKCSEVMGTKTFIVKQIRLLKVIIL